MQSFLSEMRPPPPPVTQVVNKSVFFYDSSRPVYWGLLYLYSRYKEINKREHLFFVRKFHCNLIISFFSIPFFRFLALSFFLFLSLSLSYTHIHTPLISLIDTIASLFILLITFFAFISAQCIKRQGQSYPFRKGGGVCTVCPIQYV